MLVEVIVINHPSINQLHQDVIIIGILNPFGTIPRMMLTMIR